MGQISLPRINRLNVSMFWENSTILENYKFQSIKLYVFLKYFSKYFFYYSHFDYFYFIKPKDNFLLLSGIKSYNSNNYLHYRSVNYIDLTKKRGTLSFLKNLKIYIYNFNTKFFIFFVYLNFTAFNNKKSLANPRRVTIFSKTTLYI